MICFEYSAAGRLVKEGNKTYRYGYLDKVMSVTKGDKTYTYTYHADGQLASANYGGKTEDFLWDGLALIQCGDEQFINEPHVGGGNPVASSKGTSYFNDALGTTVGSKSNGKYSAAALTAFGERLDNADGTSPAIRSLGEGWFTGKPFVEGLGHVFLMRNYRAGLAKWQTADPMGYPDGWNQLAYCRNNTQCGVDVLGGWVEEVHHDINATYLNKQGISEHAYNWGSLSLDILNGLNAGSDWTDNLWKGNQADEKAYYHAMRSSKQTTAQAEIAWANYMSQLVTNAKYLSDCARWAHAYYRFDDAAEYENLAIIELGKLLHTFDDSFSPSHAGFQHFSWAPFAAWSHRQKELMNVYETGVYKDTVYHSGGFRDYIYNEIVKTYNSTIRYVLRQPE